MNMQFDLFDQTGNDILDARDYAAFKARLAASNCDRCSLSQSRTHIVVDRGTSRAGILFIGEAPGENEDRQGRAFVGRAGKLLDELLKDVGILTEEHTLIANIVKCRPPDNRPPRQEEAEACLPFLRKQIALMKPRILVLLGATALKYFIREKSPFSMEREAGQIFQSSDYPGIDFMVLYHPAYLLYDPRKTDTMRRHIQTLAAYLEERKIPPKI
jgi:DNA polymerase